jgi:NADPH:quinone reductase-like Zn-dependent oxidoreductase
VGQALVTLARRDDVRVFAATRPGHADLARSMGAIPVGDPRQLPRELVDDGFDAVFDGIGEDGFAPSWAAVKHGGVLCAFGFSDAVRRGGSTLQLAATLLRMRAWNAFGHAHAHFYSVTAMKKAHPEWYRADLQLLLDMLAAKAIRPRIAQRVGIGGVVGAHHRLEMGHVEGKLVLCP